MTTLQNSSKFATFLEYENGGFFLYLIWCYIDFILIALINAIFTNLSTIIFDVKSPHFLIMYRSFMES